MRRIEWPVRQKRKGHSLVKTGHKFSAPFAAALRLYSEEESQRLGRKVSQPTIIETLALHADARLRRLYERLSKKGEQ